MTEKWLVLCEDEGLAARVTHIVGRSAKVLDGMKDLFQARSSTLAAPGDGHPAVPELRQTIILVIGFREDWLKDTLAKCSQAQNSKIQIIVATFGSRLSIVADSGVKVDLTVALPSVGAVLGQITSEKRMYWAQCPVSSGSILIDDVLAKIIACRRQPGLLDLTQRHQDTLPERLKSKQGILTSREDVLSQIAIQARCGLDLIYRCRPPEKYEARSVATIRLEMGEAFAKQLPLSIRNQIDVVVPIPETGRYYAQGIANELKKPYLELISKETNSGRSFDIANGATRRKFLVSKLEKVAAVEAGTTIALVDEAIFSGATVKTVAELFDDIDVSVLILIATPPSVTRCAFGMMPDRALLTEYIDINEMASYFNVNRVCFMDPEVFQRVFARPNQVCTRCFEESNSLL